MSKKDVERRQMINELTAEAIWQWRQRLVLEVFGDEHDRGHRGKTN